MVDIYFDSCLLVKLYLDEPGAAPVRALAEKAAIIASSVLSRAEFSSALHRQLREKSLALAAVRAVLGQFAADQVAARFRWLPFTEAVLGRVERTYRSLPTILPLRAADALHLATAAENGFQIIHSNDARLLAAASRFKLKGVDPTKG